MAPVTTEHHAFVWHKEVRNPRKYPRTDAEKTSWNQNYIVKPPEENFGFNYGEVQWQCAVTSLTIHSLNSIFPTHAWIEKCQRSFLFNRNTYCVFPRPKRLSTKRDAAGLNKGLNKYTCTQVFALGLLINSRLTNPGIDSSRTFHKRYLCRRQTRLWDNGIVQWP